MIITSAQMQVKPAQILRRRWNRRRTSLLQPQPNGDDDGFFSYLVERTHDAIPSGIVVFISAKSVKREPGAAGRFSVLEGEERFAQIFALGLNRPKVVAHEVGHIFGLLHPFSRRWGHPPIPRGNTRNIMDYTQRPFMFWNFQKTTIQENANNHRRQN